MDSEHPKFTNYSFHPNGVLFLTCKSILDSIKRVNFVNSYVSLKCVNPSRVNALFNGNDCANESGYFIHYFFPFTVISEIGSLYFIGLEVDKLPYFIQYSADSL